MTTWNGLVEAVRHRWEIGDQQPASFTVAWRFAFGGAPEHQRVDVEVREERGVPWLLVTAFVCDELRLPLRDALAHNATLAIGALVLHDGGYLLRLSAPLAGVDAAHVADWLELIAHEAARLRRVHAPPRDRAALAPYVDP